MMGWNHPCDTVNNDQPEWGVSPWEEKEEDLLQQRGLHRGSSGNPCWELAGGRQEESRMGVGASTDLSSRPLRADPHANSLTHPAPPHFPPHLWTLWSHHRQLQEFHLQNPLLKQAASLILNAKYSQEIHICFTSVIPTNLNHIYNNLKYNMLFSNRRFGGKSLWCSQESFDWGRQLCRHSGWH